MAGDRAIEKLRAWRSHRQGLDGRLAGRSPAEVLQETGWARSVGGVGPYLTLFARAGTRRADADAAVAALQIHEIPAARGCTYVVPASDFALALQVGGNCSDGDMKAAYKLGVTDKEIDKLSEAVLKALEAGTLDPEAIRAATGKASRSLGEEGKKKGITTTLPLALGKLQASGDIRRVPVNGRLDQQRYAYTLWRPNPIDGAKRSAEELNTELAKRYFAWTGPATAAEFQWFSGLGVKAAKAAMEPLRLESTGEAGFLLSEDRGAFEDYKPPRSPQYVLASSLDGICVLRRNLADMIDPVDVERQVYGDRGMVTLGRIAGLPSHPILDRGRLVGLWEYDTDTESIAWHSFIPRNRDLESAVGQMEHYVRTDLGDARSFSLDSPKSRQPRVEALRKGS